jgi:hypothetical protein
MPLSIFLKHGVILLWYDRILCELYEIYISYYHGQIVSDRKEHDMKMLLECWVINLILI